MSNETDQTSPTSPTTSPTSLKRKLKSSLRLPWLRPHGHHGNGTAQCASPSPLTSPGPSPKTNNSNNHNNNWPKHIISGALISPTWLKSPEFRDKCRSLINRIGHAGHLGHNGHGGHGHGHHHNGHGHHHGRRHSADFRYDPSSYALNFDEGSHDSQLDEFPMRNFSARLPRSPPPAPTATSTSREIAAYT